MAPLRTRAWLVVGTLAAWMALAVVATRLTWARVELLEYARLGGPLLTDALDALAEKQRGLARVELALAVPTLAALLAWMHRAHANLPLLGPHHRQYTPAQAVTGWFVPGINLFRPYLVMREIWQNSRSEGVDPREPGAPRTMLAWWGLGLLGLFLRWFAHRMTTAGLPEPQGPLLAAYLWLAAAWALALSAACAAWLVVDTTRRQGRAPSRDDRGATSTTLDHHLHE